MKTSLIVRSRGNDTVAGDEVLFCIDHITSFLGPVFSIFMLFANSFKVSISSSTTLLDGPAVTKVTIISGSGTISFSIIVAVQSVEITAYSSQVILSLVLYIWRDVHSISLVEFNLIHGQERVEPGKHSHDNEQSPTEDFHVR